MEEEASRIRVAERAELAAVAPRSRLEPLFEETAKEVLVALADNAGRRAYPRRLEQSQSFLRPYTQGSGAE